MHVHLRNEGTRILSQLIPKIKTTVSSIDGKQCKILKKKYMEPTTEAFLS